jgi:hypothetical protein
MSVGRTMLPDFDFDKNSICGNDIIGTPTPAPSVEREQDGDLKPEEYNF